MCLPLCLRACLLVYVSTCALSHTDYITLAQLNEEWTAADLDDDDDDGEDEDDDDDDDDDYPVSRSSISSRPVKSALIEVKLCQYKQTYIYVLAVLRADVGWMGGWVGG